MKKLLKNMTALLLLSSFLLLVACGKSTEGGDSSSLDGSGSGKGRYVEEDIPMEDTVIKQSSNGMYHAILREDEKTIMKKSTNGVDWEVDENVSSEAIDGLGIQNFSVREDGTYFFLVMEMGEMAEGEEIQTFNDEDIDYSVYSLKDGDLKQLPINPEDIRLPSDMRGMSFVGQIDALSNGKLVFRGESSAVILNAEDGAMLLKLDGEIFEGVITTLVTEDEFILMSQDKIQKISLENGEKISEINISGIEEKTESDMVLGYLGQCTLAFDQEKNGYFYVNESGIYYIDGETGIAERVVDSQMLSFSDPTTMFFNLFLGGEDEYFVQTMKIATGMKFSRVFFDKSLSTTLEKELKVYSLHENPLVRQAIIEMNKKHPDILIQYVIGITEQNKLTASDALRNLSIEIQAGNAPDIMLLDGLSIESYITQGLLADISDVIAGVDGLNESILSAARTANGLFALPTRYSLLMLGGENLPDISSLAEIGAIAKEKNAEHRFQNGDELIRMLFPYLVNDWTKDGVFNTEQFKSDMEVINTLRTEDEETFGGSMDWLLKRSDFVMEEIGSITDYTLFLSNLQERKDTKADTKIFSDDKKVVVLPTSIFGVSADSKETELAKEFVKTALTTSLGMNISQMSEGVVGIPLHKETFQKEIDEYNKQAKEGALVMMFSTEDENGVEQQVTISPVPLSDEGITEFLTDTETLSTLSVSDTILKDMFIEEANAYFNGKLTIDELVEALKNKIQLYLSEA